MHLPDLTLTLTFSSQISRITVFNHKLKPKLKSNTVEEETAIKNAVYHASQRRLSVRNTSARKSASVNQNATSTSTSLRNQTITVRRRRNASTTVTRIHPGSMTHTHLTIHPTIAVIRK